LIKINQRKITITLQIMEISSKFTFVRKLPSRSIIYINFNSFGPLEHEILEFKDFKYIKNNLII